MRSIVRNSRLCLTSGCGGFLNPPSHPEHTASVETLRHGVTPDGCMSLLSAVSADYLDEITRREARALLESWVRPALESPDVQAWIGQVLGYFRGCYRNPAKSGAEQWHASHVLIDNREPLANALDHCGVRCIRSFYPEYMPTADDFARAQWGSNA